MLTQDKVPVNNGSLWLAETGDLQSVALVVETFQPENYRDKALVFCWNCGTAEGGYKPPPAEFRYWDFCSAEKYTLLVDCKTCEV